LKCIRLVNLLLIKEKLPVYAGMVESADTTDFRQRHQNFILSLPKKLLIIRTKGGFNYE